MTGSLAVEYVPVGELVLYHRNPRRGDVGRIAESLRVNGQYRTICANRGTQTGRPNEVLAGNHTLLGIRQLGWETAAVTWVDVDDDQAARIVVVDNRTSDLADYDGSELLALLAEFEDLEGTGYTDAEFAKLLADEGEPPPSLTDPDDVPSKPIVPVSKPGDLWLLGCHRLVCGDAREAADVELALDGATPTMVFTDPPYGISYVGGTRDKLTMANDDLSAQELAELLDASFDNIEHVLPAGGAFYVCSPSGPLETTFRVCLGAAGLGLRQQLVWVKDRFVLSRSDYHGQHETMLYGWKFGDEAPTPPHFDVEHDTMLYGWKPGAAHKFEGGRKQSTAWFYSRPTRSDEHPTMKPVELVKRAVLNSSPAGGLVLDCFGGSGSTLIACHASGRVASLVELDPKYVDVICRRYQEHTGDVPVRDGQPHDFTVESPEG